MIDSHFHVWTIARGDYFWMRPDSPICRDITLDDYRPLLGDIDTAILVQAADTEAESRFMLDVANASNGLVKGVVGWVDLEADDLPARLAALAADPLFLGIRPMLQDIEETGWVLRPKVIAGLRHVRDQGLRLDALPQPRHLATLRTLPPDLGAMRVVIDHGAKPAIARGEFNPWAEHMAALARDTGWFCKFSGLATEAGPDWTVDQLRPYAEHLLRSFGPERLLWGSDWPVLTLVSSYDRWRDAAWSLIPPDDRAMVFDGAARRFYLT